MRWLFHVRVSGESMWPEFIPGKVYWASSLIRPKVGRVIIFRPDNSSGYILKRIAKINGDVIYASGIVTWSKSYTINQRQVIGVLLANFAKSRD